eukprot:7547746-Pyramimonas_sp.AAC.1
MPCFRRRRAEKFRVADSVQGEVTARTLLERAGRLPHTSHNANSMSGACSPYTMYTQLSTAC